MTKYLDADNTFFRGAKSDMDPSSLPSGYYFYGYNSINQGGLISCRPGHRCLITLPAGNLQGGAIFRPKIGIEQLLVVVDGRVFIADYPFLNFTQLTGIQFSPSAIQIFFELAEQSARRTSDGLESATELISPKNVLLMQDGGETAPAYYDGTVAEHIRGKPYETPIGSVMKWIGDRLWVATPGGFLRASDVGNPFSFREQLYLGGTDALTFTSEITAMEVTPGLETPQLLVWTESNCSVVQASIRDRNQWLETVDFQKEIFSIGSLSARSVVSKYGQIMWMSSVGLVFFDSAALTNTSSRLPNRDNELQISKAYLSGDCRLVAGAAFGQYMLMSVPSGDKYNADTWVLNSASLETLSDASGPSWSGVWTGTRPVQWLYGRIAGEDRIYHLSKDQDGENRLWESFSPDRLDNGCPITWGAELRGYFGIGGSTQKALGVDCRFRFAEVGLVGIEETLDVGLFYAGSSRGAYKQIMSRQVSAQKGIMTPDLVIDVNTQLYALKGQQRRLRSQDVNDAPPIATGSCPVESKEAENVDESFQFLIVGHGPGAVKWFRAFADAENDEKTGGGPNEACGAETPINAVRFDGVGKAARSTREVAEFLAQEPTIYTSNKTATLTYRGVTATGVGYGESLVSQLAADRVALTVATKMADNEIISQLPPVYSAGKTFA